MMAMQIQKATSEEATKIIETRQPLGLFYTIDKQGDKRIYVGIDNQDGNAWTEDFKSLSSCKNWLTGKTLRRLSCED